MRMALPFYGVVTLFAVGYALFSGGLGDLLALFAFDDPDLPWEVLGGLGIGLTLVLLTRVGARGWRPMARLTDRLADLLGPIDVRTAILLALLSGTAEELLFRGALWPHLQLIGTTLLFALVHVLPSRRLWLYPVFALLAGLLLGLVREGTESLWPPIVAHITVNAFNLAWIGRRAGRSEAPASVPCRKFLCI
jgi:membrane protease YdiL (CAAX protease family)